MPGAFADAVGQIVDALDRLGGATCRAITMRSPEIKKRYCARRRHRQLEALGKAARLKVGRMNDK